MPHIRVDNDEIEKMIGQINMCLEQMNGQMRMATDTIIAMEANWRGSDYSVFRQKWNKIINNDSSYMKEMEQLKYILSKLRYATSKYKVAQRNSFDRANRLPRI